MRSMRSASQPEFQAFIEGKDLAQRRVGQMICYLEPGEWPENLVASFIPAGEGRRRDGGWRIAVENVDADEV